MPGVPFGNDCSEPLDDTAFLMRHAALEATERLRYAASRGQQDVTMGAQAYAATPPLPPPPPPPRQAADYKLVAQAQSSGAATSGEQPRRNVLVIRRQPSDACAANAEVPTAADDGGVASQSLAATTPGVAQ